MKIFKRIFFFWCSFWFLIVFLILYPFFLLFLANKKTHALAHFLNKIWAYAVFIICMTPCHSEWRFKRDKKQPYVYCPNHSSYLDIPTLCYSLPGYFVFIGKSSLGKVPLFGYMFRTLYISVNRNSKISKYKTIIDSCAVIDQKRSLAIFPEGTIPESGHPKLISFKEGPFRVAIEKQVPIVPVTIPYNWIILPEIKKMHIGWHKMKVIFHEPIETKGMTLDDIGALKQKTFDIINTELKKHNKHLV